MSTAHVTGAIAQLLGRNPKLTSAAVYQLLRTTSYHDDLGGDSINVCAALISLMGHGLCHHETVDSGRIAMH